MQVLLSPAKSLNENFPENFSPKVSQPIFFEQTKILAEILIQKSPADLQSLFSVSEKIADLNVGRYQNFPTELHKKNSFPALTCFDGAVYKPIETEKFSTEDWNFAQQNLKILSGFYGFLRPLDLLYPYRLEMGTKLANPAGKNLYEFWSEKITTALNKKNEPIINLASKEYFSVLNEKKITQPIFHIHFKENKNGRLKIVAIHAKKARGAMANQIIQQKITDPQKIKNIEILDYKFLPAESDEQNFVFAR